MHTCLLWDLVTLAQYPNRLQVIGLPRKQPLGNVVEVYA